MNIVFAVREHVNCMQKKDEDNRDKAWEALCAHPNFGQFDFQRTVVARTIRQKHGFKLCQILGIIIDMFLSTLAQ